MRKNSISNAFKLSIAASCAFLGLAACNPSQTGTNAGGQAGSDQSASQNTGSAGTSQQPGVAATPTGNGSLSGTSADQSATSSGTSTTGR